MSITLYPHAGEDFPNMFGNPTEYGNPIPVIDANHLYSECVGNGLPTDWWYPLANTITLNAGKEPSVAYLLINKIWLDGATADVAQPLVGVREDIPALKKNKRYLHKIVLSDHFSALDEDADEDYTAPIEIVGWVFHSARAIDGSNDPNDPATVYLVKFVDVRWLLARKPWWFHHISEDPSIESYSINASSRSEWTDGMSGSVTTAGEFPFATNNISLSSWESALASLWYNPAQAYYGDTDIPAGGDYPDEGPIDFYTNNRNSFDLFCELLHASGNELFQKLDGHFIIKPIDAHFNMDSALDPYKKYVVEQGHPIPDDKLLPPFVSVRMRLRTYSELAITNNYLTNYIYRVSDEASANGVGASLVGESVVPYGGEILAGASDTPAYSMGMVEDILTPAVSYIEWMPETATEYWDYLDSYSRHIAEKLIKSRLDNQVDATYGRFIPLAPCPEFERVTFFFYNGAPATRFESLPSKIYDGTSLEYMAQIADDRYVAADPTDSNPKTLVEKIEDTSTYDAETHQLVWAEMVEHGTGLLDNKVRFFTTLGTGTTGPPGPPGASGPTYAAGCGIVIAGTTIYVSNGALAGVGMQVDPQATTTCSISPYPPDLAGKGLISATDNVANQEVFIKVNPDDLYSSGGGLTQPATGNNDTRDGLVKLKIKPEDLVTSGSGLMVATDNTTAAAGPVKIKIRPIDLCGKGLKVSSGNQDDANGPVKIEINPDDTDTTYTIRNPIRMELDDLGGTLNVKLIYKDVKVQGYLADSSEKVLVDSFPLTECP